MSGAGFWHTPITAVGMRFRQKMDFYPLPNENLKIGPSSLTYLDSKFLPHFYAIFGC